jgi:multidrug transporter EmrE-like cation transporter
MTPRRFAPDRAPAILSAPMKNAALLVCYFLFVTASNVFLKLSADSRETWVFLTMFAAGNVAGFVGILAYTGLLRTLPLHVAFPLSRGLVVLGVQLAASLVFFHERFTLKEAGAVALVTAGIVLVGVAAPRAPASVPPASNAPAAGAHGTSP